MTALHLDANLDPDLPVLNRPTTPEQVDQSRAWLLYAGGYEEFDTSTGWPVFGFNEDPPEPVQAHRYWRDTRVHERLAAANFATMAPYATGVGAPGISRGDPLDRASHYPQAEAHTWGAFAGLAVELGGYGDLTVVNPYTGAEYWTLMFDPDDLQRSIRVAIADADRAGLFARRTPEQQQADHDEYVQRRARIDALRAEAGL